MNDIVRAAPLEIDLSVPTSLGTIRLTVEYAVVSNHLIIGQPQLKIHGKPGVDVVRLVEGEGLHWSDVALARMEAK